MNDKPIRIGVVCEATADFRTASTLADRVLCAHERLASWLHNELLPHVRCYVGPDDSRLWFTWAEMKKLARQLNIDFQGHFNEQPHAPDAVMAVRAIRVIRRLLDTEAVMLIRDDDGVATRKVGFEQARKQEEDRHQSTAIIVGLASTKRECWVLAGFDPRDASEQSRLESERQKLGFDPREHSHRLTAKHEPANDKLSAKRVLGILTNEDHHRERACWEDADLNLLRQRGAHSGLRDFLEEVERRLVPLLLTKH